MFENEIGDILTGNPAEGATTACKDMAIYTRTCQCGYVKLSTWAREQGISYKTAWRLWKVEAVQETGPGLHGRQALFIEPAWKDMESFFVNLPDQDSRNVFLSNIF